MDGYEKAGTGRIGKQSRIISWNPDISFPKSFLVHRALPALFQAFDDLAKA
jgi:hypothetical protein